jgi:hypothetical protein
LAIRHHFRRNQRAHAFGLREMVSLSAAMRIARTGEIRRSVAYLPAD